MKLTRGPAFYSSARKAFILTHNLLIPKRHFLFQDIAFGLPSTACSYIKHGCSRFNINIFISATINKPEIKYTANCKKHESLIILSS